MLSDTKARSLAEVIGRKEIGSEEEDALGALFEPDVAVSERAAGICSCNHLKWPCLLGTSQ